MIKREVYRRLGVDTGDTLPAYVWPGGYPVLYYDSDFAILCPNCANKWIDYSTDLIATDVYYEGPPEVCQNCYTEIESAYGDPDQDD